VRRNCRYLFLISFLLPVCIPFAAAQATATFSIGLGTNQVKSNGSGLFNANSYYAFNACTPGLDPNCDRNPGLRGLALGIGGDVLPWKHVGFGFNVNLMPSKDNYGPLQFRQTFYDFNGIYAPVNEKRVVVKLLGGIGGAKTGFSYDETSCVGTAICQSSTTAIGSENHFQLHAGAGVELYITKSLFIRPEFNFRHITGFTDQFGKNNVLGGMVWLGFRAGGR